MTRIAEALITAIFFAHYRTVMGDHFSKALMTRRFTSAYSIAVMAAALATPTLAASHKHTAPATAVSVVTTGDRVLGADPDVNIRTGLLRDAYMSEH